MKKLQILLIILSTFLLINICQGELKESDFENMYKYSVDSSESNFNSLKNYSYINLKNLRKPKDKEFYIISFNAKKFTPIKNYKFYIPPFTKKFHIQGHFYRGNTNNMGKYIGSGEGNLFLRYSIRLGNFPGSNGTNNNGKFFDGVTLKKSGDGMEFYSPDMLRLSYIPPEIYKYKFGKYIYMSFKDSYYKNLNNNESFPFFKILYYLDKNLVDFYIDTKNYPKDEECENLKNHKIKAKRNSVKLCYFIKNLDTSKDFVYDLGLEVSNYRKKRKIDLTKGLNLISVLGKTKFKFFKGCEIGKYGQGEYSGKKAVFGVKRNDFIINPNNLDTSEFDPEMGIFIYIKDSCTLEYNYR